MTIKARVGGLRELKVNLRRVTTIVSPRELDEVAAQALQPIHLEIERNARAHRDPENPNPPGGHLDEGVVTARAPRSAGANNRRKRTFWTAFRKRARKIAHLVEFGTAPHWQPRRRIMHPGARPMFFARRAYEARKQATLDQARLLLARKLTAKLIK